MLFTVVTVTYNSGLYLKQAVDSILAQQYADFELIIGDDCSSDNTWEIISRYNDPRIKKYRNDKNIGEYANRSKAIQQASGKYLIFIDGDDRMYDHALLTFARYVNLFPEAAMFFCREWDPRILCPLLIDPLMIYRFEYLDLGIIGGNFTDVLFKTEILKKYNFLPGVRSGDTYIQLKIAQEYGAVVMPRGLAWWRRRKDNATQQLFKDNKYLAESLRYRVSLLNEGCPLPTAEVTQAKINIYGIFLRILIRLIVKLKFAEVAYLLKNADIPRNYYSAMFKSSKYIYYSNITGDNPLHTETGISNV